MNHLVLILEIAGRRAALRTAEVQSVVELDAVCTVPGAPSFVRGLTALRSCTLTVIDGAAAIGLAPHGPLEVGARAAIVDHAGHRYALVVDVIDDVAEALGDPSPVPGEAGAGWQRVSDGLIETDRGPALLLALGTLLAGPLSMAA
jgi:purine-binding chemotaxis protein CheW